MRRLITLFKFPFILICVIILWISLYIKHKKEKSITIYNFQSIVYEIGIPLCNKYKKHSLPFSLIFWILLYLMFR